MKLFADGIHDDTAALQSLLDGCGVIRIDRPGTYRVERTLIVHSNTRLILSPGARLLAAPRSRCALIENEHFAGGGRDENIEIVGGIWDGNCDEMGLDAEYEAIHRLDHPYSPARFMGKLMRFAHVDRLLIAQLTVRNPVSYGIQIGGADGFTVRDIFFDYNWHFGTTDGVHVNGASYHGLIENLRGTTNDDMIGMTTYDEPHAEITLGDIENIVIRNITATNGYSGVRLCSGENCAIRSVHIDGIYGDFRHHAVIISNHNKRPGTVWFDQIVMERIFVRKSNTPLGEGCFRYWERGAERASLILFTNLARCGSVTLRDVMRREQQSSPAYLIKIDESAEIDRLYLENVCQIAGEGVDAPFYACDGKVSELIERGVTH